MKKLLILPFLLFPYYSSYAFLGVADVATVTDFITETMTGYSSAYDEIANTMDKAKNSINAVKDITNMAKLAAELERTYVMFDDLYDNLKRVDNPGLAVETTFKGICFSMKSLSQMLTSTMKKDDNMTKEGRIKLFKDLIFMNYELQKQISALNTTLFYTSMNRVFSEFIKEQYYKAPAEGWNRYTKKD